MTSVAASKSSLQSHAMARSAEYFDTGAFVAELGRLVSIPSEGQCPSGHSTLQTYLSQGLLPLLQVLDFEVQIHENPDPAGGPILLAHRIESVNLPTVLLYGHGDVSGAMEPGWAAGLAPYVVTEQGDRIFGRGTADNKAQHLVNIRALAALIATQGCLGFNARVLIETSEESGSPGLKAFCETHCAELEADVLIASNGPRLSPETPAIFAGSRGSANFDLRIDLRNGPKHSGNFGGVLADPTILMAHAIASITDARGQIRIPEWRPTSLTQSIRDTLADLPQVRPGFPLDPGWGEERLTMAERTFGWNCFSVLAMVSGDPQDPCDLIPGWARASCQLRYVVGTDPDDIMPALRRHLDREGFRQTAVVATNRHDYAATRLPLNHPWLTFAASAFARATGKTPHVLPNSAGSLPNDIFYNTLGMPTVWIPHSYTGSNAQAPNEHILRPIIREGLIAMTGLFADICESGAPT